MDAKEGKKAAKETNPNRPAAKADPRRYAKEGINLQSRRETLRDHKLCSQATIFQFIMELEDVGRDGQERPFRGDLWCAPAQETAILQILLGEGKGAFGLNGAVDAQQLALRGIDLRFHGLSLSSKAFGDVDDLAALLQRLLAAAGANTLLLQRAALAVVTDVD